MKKLFLTLTVILLFPLLCAAQQVEEACPPGTKVIPNLQTRNTTTNGLRQQACVDVWGRILLPGTAVGLINVQSYGARGDGTTDDTGAFAQAIITAQITGFGLYVPTTTSRYIVSSGFSLPRNFQVVCSPPGAEIRLAAAAGTLFTFGTVTDGGWQAGGVTYCRLSGNGGGADTSRGVQIGSGTLQAHGVHLTHVEVSSFGHGVVASGNGNGFAAVLDHAKIHNNACNGILFEGTQPEEWTVISSMIFNNGNGSATCTGVQVAAGAGGAARFISTHFDNNGNGTLGQVHSVATASAEWAFTDDHFEDAGQADSNDIVCLAQGGPRCAIRIANTKFVQNPGTPTGKAVIVFAAADVEIVNSTFSMTAGAALSPFVNIGASVGGQGMWFISRNNIFTCNGGGTPANCQTFSVTGSAAFLNYDITGTALSGFGAATNLHNIIAGTVGCHDLGTLANLGGPTGERICSGGMVIGGGTKILKVLSATGTLDFASAAANTCSAVLTITVTGAALGDTVSIGVPNASVNAGSQFSGWVSAANTVSVRHCNISAAANDPASGTFRATVHQF